jgi:hypothetical protein
MSDYVPKPNRGNLFKNKNKQEGDNRPDWDGRITLSVDLLKELVTDHKSGKEPVIKIAQWDNVSRTNGMPLRGTIIDRPMSQEQSQPKPEIVPDPPKASDDFDDDIPF